MRYCLLFLLTLVFTNAATAQVPLDSAIRMQITARDTSLLPAYNIYSFDYTENGRTYSADFLVAKPDDTFSRKSYILGKLQRLTEYRFTLQTKDGKALTVPVEDGMEVKKDKDTDAVYLNFNPQLPDPVFLLKEVLNG